MSASLRERSTISPGLMKQVAAHLAHRPFHAPAALRNGHLMTAFGFFCPRRCNLSGWPGELREFRTESEVRVLAHCHWQEERKVRPSLILLHGLEASSEARYSVGTAEKALRAGFNVVRLNMRGCGRAGRLRPMLYHCGLTTDLHYIVRELIERDGLPESARAAIIVIADRGRGLRVPGHAGFAGEDQQPCGLPEG
ncbi:MAG TPA: hypothetical protein VFD58_05095 [Blastocatellia bacterium]|nr:hypothetical protein [Blastocatellia bacterium]